MLDVKLKEINFNKQKYILFSFIFLFLLIFLIANLKNNKEITTDFLKTKYINYILKEKELEVYKNYNYSIYNSYNKKEQEIILNDKTSYKYSKNYYTLYDDKNNILFDSFSKKENKELINKKIINSLDNNNLIFVKNYYLKEYNIEKIYFQISINVQIEDRITKIYFNKQLFELEKMKDEKRKIILKILNSKDVIPIHKNFF